MAILPGIKGFLDKHKEYINDFFKPSEEGVRVRDVVRELPKATLDTLQEQGQTAMRGFAVAGSTLVKGGRKLQAAIDPYKTYKDYEEEYGTTDLTPTGSFQEALYGTKDKITAGGFGAEIRGGKEQKRFDPILGVMFGMADAIPGGSAAKGAAKGSITVAKKGLSTLDNLMEQKYGPTIAKKIADIGDENLKWSSLVKGGEETIANVLNQDRVRMATDKLVDSFKDINRARTELERTRSLQRTEKAAKAEQALQQTEGFESLRAARSAMKGELEAGQVPNIGENMSNEEVDLLFNHIRTSSNLKVYERVNALEGLARMMGDPYYNGELPTPSQMKMLNQVFGDPLVRNFNSTVGKGEKIAETVAQVLNIPRALMSSLDFSAPLRQGLVLAVDKPKNAGRAFVSMFKYFGDERYFNAAMDQIASSPIAPLRQQSGLELTDVSGQNFSLGTKEEAYMTDLITNAGLKGDAVRSVIGGTAGAFTGDTAEERIKNALIGAGFGSIARKGVSASERAFTGFLNKLRADVFDDVAKQYMSEGMRPETHPEEFESLARFINIATGRGEIKSKKLRGAAPLMNSVFFSPRFLASRIQMFDPRMYMSLPVVGSSFAPSARKMAARSMMKLIGTGLGILSLASLNKDAKVGTDTRSSDFGKIRMGDTRYDIWGGFQQWAVLGSRLILGETKSASSGKIRTLDGQDYFGQTRASVVSRFFRSKLSPVAGSIWDFADGRTVVGEEVTVSQQLKSRLLPFFFQDLLEAGQEEGYINAAVKLSPGLFGVGVQNFNIANTKSSASLPGFGGGRSSGLPGL